MDKDNKNAVSKGELARQERARKFRQSVLYRSMLDNRRNQVWLYNVANMHRIQRLGLNMFDANGQLLVRNPTNLRRDQMSADIFLTELIDYWLEQDAPYAYSFCAQADKLLNPYRVKYSR